MKPTTDEALEARKASVEIGLLRATGRFVRMQEIYEAVPESESTPEARAYLAWLEHGAEPDLD